MQVMYVHIEYRNGWTDKVLIDNAENEQDAIRKARAWAAESVKVLRMTTDKNEPL